MEIEDWAVERRKLAKKCILEYIKLKKTIKHNKKVVLFLMQKYEITEPTFYNWKRKYRGR